MPFIGESNTSPILPCAQSAADAPICLIVPGLTSSSSSAYVRRAAATLHATGVRVGCYNPRGRGGNVLQTPFLYSAGFTEDVRRVVSHVRQVCPEVVSVLR